MIQDRHCVFGEIENERMILNAWGEIAVSEWHKSFDIRSELFDHAFVLMPNHLHAIVEIDKVTSINPNFCVIRFFQNTHLQE